MAFKPRDFGVIKRKEIEKLSSIDSSLAFSIELGRKQSVCYSNMV